MFDPDGEFPPLVIDNGSGWCKAGFAGEDLPRDAFPSVVATPRLHQHGPQEFYVGDYSQGIGPRLDFNYPVKHGIITNWDHMERIWHHTFYNELRADPEYHVVLLADSPLNTINNRERMAQSMFETFAVPAMFIQNQAVLSLFSSGRTSGLVLDCGDDVSTTVPIYDGLSLPSATHQLDFAGRALTEYLAQLLAPRRHFSRSEREVVRDIKEKTCYIALDVKEETNNSPSNGTTTETPYELPDGTFIMLQQQERCLCPEALFEPSLINRQGPGIHECAHLSVMDCDIDLHRELYTNVILSGGSTMFAGFSERLTRELTRLASSETNVRVIAPAERRYSAWMGGSVLAAMTSFEDMCISKAEYDEAGSAIVRRKFCVPGFG
jgi:actin-related protein